MTTPTTDDATTPLSSAMVPASQLYADLDTELAATRRMLERVPDGRMDWRPHEKSMTLGRLASHIAESPIYTVAVLTTDEFDIASGAFTPADLGTTAEILALFDGSAAKMRAALAAADPASLGRMWTFRNGDQVILTLPKGALVRSWGISHLVHHRAQLSVYLRMLDVPVPGMYGPSADEQF